MKEILTVNILKKEKMFKKQKKSKCGLILS